MKKITKLVSSVALLGIILVGGAKTAVNAMTMYGDYRVSGFDVRWSGIYTVGRSWTMQYNSGQGCGASIYVGSGGQVRSGRRNIDFTYSRKGAWLDVGGGHWYY